VNALPGSSSKNKPATAYTGALASGTCIKLYSYRWKKKTLVTTDGRYELERFLHSVPLPLRISETREYKANYYSTTFPAFSRTSARRAMRRISPQSSRLV